MYKNYKTVLHIYQTGVPGSYDPKYFWRNPGGDNEKIWLDVLLHDLGLTKRVKLQSSSLHLNSSLPLPTQVDAVILNGLFLSLDDVLSWHDTLIQWLEEFRTLKRPLLALGAAHVQVCTLLGAETSVLEKSFFAGTFPVHLSPQGKQHFLFESFKFDPRFHFYLKENVVTLPPSSIPLAFTQDFPFLACDHLDSWYSFHALPHFSKDTMLSCLGPDLSLYQHLIQYTPKSYLFLLHFLQHHKLLV